MVAAMRLGLAAGPAQAAPSSRDAAPPPLRAVSCTRVPWAGAGRSGGARRRADRLRASLFAAADRGGAVRAAC